ncbi:MAG: bis(5'-nucleosyl)-tetraphosphatase (symmetrical) YqeK [bacterium]|nr:bis(5'-nucleosyl)-tetraphosphatase (symmetrical) YqeK [bacterium]
MSLDPDTIEAQLRARLSRTRFAHTMRVVAVAEALARRHGADLYQVRIAALLHDLARDLEGPELLNKATEYGILVDEIEAREPVVLHARVGAAEARHRLGVRDPLILQAVERHTTGAPGMTMLDTIIYVADHIEPGRDSPGVGDVREAAAGDLNRALVLAMNGCLGLCIRENRPIHPRTVEARNEALNNLAATDHCRTDQ